MRKGHIFVQLSGHRKPTTYRCNRCSQEAGETVWHDTPRGPNPSACPYEMTTIPRPKGHTAVKPKSPAPAHIPRAKLGSGSRMKTMVPLVLPGPRSTV